MLAERAEGLGQETKGRNVVWLDLKDLAEIANGEVELAQLTVGEAPLVVGTRELGVHGEGRRVVGDGLGEATLGELGVPSEEMGVGLQEEMRHVMVRVVSETAEQGGYTRGRRTSSSQEPCLHTFWKRFRASARD